jgi:hypothetical protein
MGGLWAGPFERQPAPEAQGLLFKCFLEDKEEA